MKVHFNSKEFLSLPLNDGSNYFSDGNCGCIKGNFAKSLLELKEQPCLEMSSQQLYYILGDPVGHISLGKTPKRAAKAVRRTKKLNRFTNLSTALPKLQEVLDIGEYILLEGYPQKAKLYVAHMIEKFNLCELIQESPIAADTTTTKEEVLCNA